MSRVVAIHIAEKKAAPMQAVAEIRAIPGHGLEGDRYFKRQGSFSKWEKNGRAVTIIAAEAIESFNQKSGCAMEFSDSRRNITVRGVPVQDLIGHTFRIGEVTLRGEESAEPCGHLERLTGLPVREGLKGRCGIRASILDEGIVHVGDEVVILSEKAGGII